MWAARRSLLPTLALLCAAFAAKPPPHRASAGLSTCAKHQLVASDLDVLAGSHTATSRGVIRRGYGNPPRSRLGNHMFMYASALGIARSNSMEFISAPWPSFLRPSLFEVFNITTPVATEQRAAGFTSLSEQKYRTLAFETACMRLRRGSYSLNGYRQSFRYFSSASTAAELRRHFAFRDPAVKPNAKAWLLNGAASLGLGERRDSLYMVGVHYRWEMARHKVRRLEGVCVRLSALARGFTFLNPALPPSLPPSLSLSHSLTLLPTPPPAP